ncbi:MAG: hypothetical protein FJ279_36130 [Planctomycetes bacterium]|nr:hypothetical protein [Planctomycetota bacterium]MBM4085396.1 hypothetical protein [Planctomycetota bacterium]
MFKENQSFEIVAGEDRQFIILSRKIGADVAAQFEALALRRDMVALLTYLRDNRVVGTQATGNLPLKAVREVAARFVDPPKLEDKNGDRIRRTRSELDVWRLNFLHTLAHAGGLRSGGALRQLKLTPLGSKFLAAPAIGQVHIMLVIWWTQVNWLMAYPYVGMGERLPDGFEATALNHLLALPVGSNIPFEPFADKLIQDGGLTWTAPDLTHARMLLHGAIKHMVLRILADFGMVELKHREKPLGRGTIPEMVAFRVIPVGGILLESLAAW